MENQEKQYENKPPVFADGLGWQPVPPTFSEKFRGSMWFDVSKFTAFLNQHKNERGYVEIYMMKNLEKGSIWFMLNEKKQKEMPKEESEAYHNRYQHPDPNVQLANDKTAEQLFNRPLSEEEEYNLSQKPF